MEPSLSALIAEPKVIGLRQVIRGIGDNQIRCVLIAADADEPIRRQLITLCSRHQIPVMFTPSKAELGREAGIEVSCATVGFLKRA